MKKNLVSYQYEISSSPEQKDSPVQEGSQASVNHKTINGKNVQNFNESDRNGPLWEEVTTNN